MLSPGAAEFIRRSSLQSEATRRKLAKTSPAGLKEPDDNAPGFLAVCPVAEPRRRPCPVAGGDRPAPSRPDRGVGEDAADDPPGVVHQGRGARLRALPGARLEGVQKRR